MWPWMNTTTSDGRALDDLGQLNLAHPSYLELLRRALT
jgi:hypothetical protein